MIKRLVFLLCLWNTACAELPPVSGSGGNVSPSPAAASSVPPASAANLFEMTKRLEQMQAEVQQLTGKVEEQAFQIEELKKQQKTMFKDFDDRLLSVENNGSGSKPAESAAPAADTGPVPATVSADKPAASKAASESVTVPETAPVPAPAAPPLTEAEKQDYQKAYDALRNGQTNESIGQFKAYLANHPSSAYASNAKYWLGEGYRVNLNNAEAKKAFTEVVQNYPASNKVPDALFKLGAIEAEEKNVEKAREYYTRITTEFPSSRAAGLAQKKLQALGGATP